MTSRIITKEDIEHVLAHISKTHKDGSISTDRAQRYRAFVLFGAFSGQRSLATIAKLTVGQFREALKFEKPCIEVESSQDKIKMQHYVPLHPQVLICDKRGVILSNHNTWFHVSRILVAR